jgi:hypothetical protein
MSPFPEKRGPTRVLTPGALYRAPRQTIAIVGLPEVKAEITEVSSRK